MARHGAPVCLTHKIPARTRSAGRRGRPRDAATGRSGTMAAQAAGVSGGVPGTAMMAKGGGVGGATGARRRVCACCARASCVRRQRDQPRRWARADPAVAAIRRRR